MNSREVKDLLEQLDDIRGSLRNLERIGDLVEVLEEIASSLSRVKEENYYKALKHAINVIESYEADIKDINLKGGLGMTGFCQGTIYKEAIKDIRKIAGTI